MPEGLRECLALFPVEVPGDSFPPKLHERSSLVCDPEGEVPVPAAVIVSLPAGEADSRYFG